MSKIQTDKVKPLPRAYKAHINRLTVKLRRHFFLLEYLGRTCFYEVIPKCENAAAAIDTDPTYLQLTLKVSEQVLDMWEAKDYEMIWRCLVHEFSHTITEPLYRIAIDAATNSSQKFVEEVRERQTQRIANIVASELPRSFWMPESNRPSKKPRRKHG
jgi:hypothetical protein